MKIKQVGHLRDKKQERTRRPMPMRVEMNCSPMHSRRANSVLKHLFTRVGQLILRRLMVLTVWSSFVMEVRGIW